MLQAQKDALSESESCYNNCIISMPVFCAIETISCWK